MKLEPVLQSEALDFLKAFQGRMRLCREIQVLSLKMVLDFLLSVS